MAQVMLLPAPRRTDAESIAYRAAISPPRPRPAVHRIGPPVLSRRPELQELLAYPFPEPLWARLGRQALDENEATGIAKAIDQLARRKADDLAWHAARRAAYAQLIPHPTA